MSTGLLELHEDCCRFQNSCMISEQGPVPRQGSPFVPGSSVESSFNKLFSKLFYFHHPLLPCLACWMRPLSSRGMEMFWLHSCCTFQLLTPLQIGCMHRKHFVLSVRVCAHMCCSLCVCIQMCVLLFIKITFGAECVYKRAIFLSV